ncbi:hypothetical protein VNO77_33980 [Canavalia gladiata]|uniref:FACT complex subunit n=1 Tax=Canavalia gladiata TaxID=3824 RepID=A0AAN9KFS0_CANGL
MKNFVVSELKNVIDEEKKIMHSTLMEETKKVILEPSKENLKLKAENVDICYPPIFQSGEEFDLILVELVRDAPNIDFVLTKFAGAGIGVGVSSRTETEVASSMSSKALKEVAYSFNEDEDEERPSTKSDANGVEPFMKREGENRSNGRASIELVAYKSINDLSPPKEMMIQIDQKNEAVLLPINGRRVPFHVAII